MNKISKKIIESLNKEPEVIKSVNYSRIGFDFYDNNLIMFKLDEKGINWFYTYGKDSDKIIDSRKAKRISIKEERQNDNCRIIVTYKQDEYLLEQYFRIQKDESYFTTFITLKSDKHILSSNQLVPMDFVYPSFKADQLFLSLEEKMLCIPYDNDMWVHYDSSYFHPGLISYDVTAIYDDHDLRGMVIGALDFDVFKNAIRVSAYDARSFSVISGVSDDNSHDHLEHGYISGYSLSSSRFICGFYEDIRNGLENYGKLLKKENLFHWDHGVPFGYNTYSALAMNTNIDHLYAAADFIKNELTEFKSEDGVTYINFDATFGISKKEIKQFVETLHKRNQKVGWYMNPLSHLQIQDYIPLRGNKLKFRKDILLKNKDGSLYPKIDNKYPIDITIPEAELDFRLALREFVRMDFDYLKIDFLSHGAVEGQRYNKNIKTGRQALVYFYNIIKEELDPAKINKDVFISLSIAPLFPSGYGHSRRASCDAFGHHEDIKYILNALTYGWWINNSLYQFTDPDHTVLYHSKVDGTDSTTDVEAKSRYNASIISGTVMLLSDNYGKDGDKKIIDNSILRARKYANNSELNKIARLNRAFRPLTMHNTSNIFYLNDHDNYLAVFNYENSIKCFEINPKKINFKSKGKLKNLNTGKISEYKNKILVKLRPYDSCILKYL